MEIAGCGVCHTDLGYLYDGVRTNQPLSLILGHEISGRVVETGQGAEQWAVIILIPAVIPCGTCDHCERGLGTICRHQKMPGNDIQGGLPPMFECPHRDFVQWMKHGWRQWALGLLMSPWSLMMSLLPTIPSDKSLHPVD